MNENRTHHRGRTVFLWMALCLVMAVLMGRLFFLMIFRADYYGERAEELHERGGKHKKAVIQNHPQAITYFCG